MRIISGQYKGRKLIDTSKFNLRPTADRNRESLFNILDSHTFIQKFKKNIRDSIVIDMFAGTASVGLEFLSRGAKEVYFIDIEKNHLDIAKKNFYSLTNNQDATKFIKCDIFKVDLNIYFNTIADYVFIDPPYEKNYLEIINKIEKWNFIDLNTILIIEAPDKVNFDEFIINSNIAIIDNRKYGKSCFYFLKQFQI